MSQSATLENPPRMAHVRPSWTGTVALLGLTAQCGRAQVDPVLPRRALLEGAARRGGRPGEPK